MKTDPCAELVARCFAVRTAVHYAHFQAETFAAHVQLEEFYEGLLEATDKFAECHMGIEGRFKAFPAAPIPTGTPVDILEGLHTWVAKNRSACADGSTELANLIDEILSTIDRSYYKLKFLK